MPGVIVGLFLGLLIAFFGLVGGIYMHIKVVEDRANGHDSSAPSPPAYGSLEDVMAAAKAAAIAHLETILDDRLAVNLDRAYNTTVQAKREMNAYLHDQLRRMTERLESRIPRPQPVVPRSPSFPTSPNPQLVSTIKTLERKVADLTARLQAAEAETQEARANIQLVQEQATLTHAMMLSIPPMPDITPFLHLPGAFEALEKKLMDMPTRVEALEKNFMAMPDVTPLLPLPTQVEALSTKVDAEKASLNASLSASVNASVNASFKEQVGKHTAAVERERRLARRNERKMTKRHSITKSRLSVSVAHSTVSASPLMSPLMGLIEAPPKDYNNVEIKDDDEDDDEMDCIY
ncbi:hypothetical protein BU24DRAFT_453162 [Aaosphaeria arxii CBS 175.79]|uniref:Uncharacterized protein n=1 Tax=Aaosphaeria arxii CBS 175.79 TaxID=1450172 RepID=A0A6A5XJ02_9PLEO|nr:uncharacterized protein BU24DRAFT_453162 [Aaosphaeria arxii CBS 175.79]KAF2012839.1 hypothetical protein BU24DRAFT_453162 [Aaosphaeria arxii CBS 175.79]